MGGGVGGGPDPGTLKVDSAPDVGSGLRGAAEGAGGSRLEQARNSIAPHVVGIGGRGEGGFQALDRELLLRVFEGGS